MLESGHIKESPVNQPGGWFILKYSYSEFFVYLPLRL